MTTGQLTVSEGKAEHLEQVFLLPPKKERLLGRSSVCNFRLNDVLISSMHCLFSYEENEDKFIVTDLLSANGVLVQDKLIDSYALEEGSKIRVGRTTLSFSPHREKERGKTYIFGDKLDFSLPIIPDEAPKASPAEGKQVPLGRMFHSSEDLNVCRLAIKNGLTTHDEIREYLKIQEKETASQSMADILTKNRKLEPKDIEKLLLEHNYYKVLNKDMHLAKAILHNKILKEEQIQECLSLQRNYFKETQELPRLGELIVQKGYLSIQENNRIVKSLLRKKY